MAMSGEIWVSLLPRLGSEACRFCDTITAIGGTHDSYFEA
jgi:hypothetical protein